MSEISDRLAEAEKAYHALMTGTSVVKFRDQNGEEITYSLANANKLMAYILDLRRQTGVAKTSGPMQAWF